MEKNIEKLIKAQKSDRTAFIREDNEEYLDWFGIAKLIREGKKVLLHSQNENEPPVEAALLDEINAIRFMVEPGEMYPKHNLASFRDVYNLYVHKFPILIQSFEDPNGFYAKIK